MSPVAFTLALALHPEHDHAATAFAASDWSAPIINAWLPIALILSLGMYALGLRRLGRGASPRRPEHGPLGERALPDQRGERALPSLWRWSAVSFVLGWLAMAVALVGPIDRGADVLFWVHMTQHELLMLVAAPLMVLGRPLVVWLWALPLPSRLALVRGSRTTRISRAWWVATTPVVAWALHGLALWVWHVPAPYQAVLRHEWLHLFQHVCFLGTAVIFWWSVVHGRHGRLGYGAAVLYVFTTALHSGILGALLTFASSPWYPIYVERSRALGWPALEDQQMAGLLMWVPAGVIFIVLALGLFAAWMGESERRVAFGQADSLARAAGKGKA